MLIPAIGPQIDVSAVLDRLDGLLITGSPSNVEPMHYGGPPSREGTLHDPDRDATTLPLIREAVRRDLPVLAICRGIQELNVALGGTLHQRIFEMPERFNHRRRKGPMTHDERYGPAHPVALTEGGVLRQLAGGADEIMVNSLHGQGIDRPAPDLIVEAVAPDGQIEAVSLPGAAICHRRAMAPRIQGGGEPLLSRAVRRIFAGLPCNQRRDLRQNDARLKTRVEKFRFSACVFARRACRIRIFLRGRGMPHLWIQKRRGSKALLTRPRFPCGSGFPPSASDKQAPGPPPDRAPFCFAQERNPGAGRGQVRRDGKSPGRVKMAHHRRHRGAPR